jgi:hypothetical protein
MKKKTLYEGRKKTKKEIDNLKAELNAKFATKIDGMDARFSTKFDGVYTKFDNIEQVLGLQALKNRNSVKLVVIEWEEFNNGKAILGAIIKVVKMKCAQEKIPNSIFTNILTKIQDLVRIKDPTKSSPIIETIKIIITKIDKEDKLDL